MKAPSIAVPPHGPPLALLTSLSLPFFIFSWTVISAVPPERFNVLHAEITYSAYKADDKILVGKISKKVRPSYIILKIQRLEGKQCRSK